MNSSSQNKADQHKNYLRHTNHFRQSASDIVKFLDKFALFKKFAKCKCMQQLSMSLMVEEIGAHFCCVQVKTGAGA
jgi:hypothetical protein